MGSSKIVTILESFPEFEVGSKQSDLSDVF